MRRAGNTPVLACGFIAELGEDREDLALAGYCGLEVLVLVECDDTVGAWGRLTGQDQLLGCLASRVLPCRQRPGPVVRPVCVNSLLATSASWSGRSGGYAGCGRRGEHEGEHRS